MQKTSAEYERLAKSVNKIYETKLDIDGVGTFDGESIISIKTNIALFKGQPKIGTAVSAEIDVSMLMPSVEIPRMACLRPYVRAKGTVGKSSAVTIVDGVLSSPYANYSNGKITFSAESGATYANGVLSFPVDSTEELTSEWIPQGVYFIDTRKVTANNNGLDILTLHGYDAMLKTEQPYSSNDTVGDATDTQYVQAIADAIGVEVDSRTWEIMIGYTIPFPLGYSMREVLGFIATSYVGCFVMTDEGKLRLVSLLGLPEYSRESLLADEYDDIIIFGEDAILV